MDINPEASDVLIEPLSYDEVTPYDEQVPAPLDTPVEPPRSQLADRISHTKVYLLSEASSTRLGKRKHGEGKGTDNTDGDIEMDEDSPYRDNAILFRGSPISHLPTPSIFAYATHFDSHPIALEWIDDTTCILVFDSKATARSAYRHLAKSIAEEPSSEDGSVTAKPIPIALWPPEERINKSLGKGEGLKGAIRMRWATHQDVKKRGAKKESEFYRKYGEKAGRSLAGDETTEVERDDERLPKRRRRGDLEELTQKARLDDELEAFLAEDDVPPEPPSPPSKMRSDYIAADGKTLLERTSVMRARPDTLASRMVAELPRRARSQRDRGRTDDHVRSERRPRTRERRDFADEERRPEGRGTHRPKKTQQDLDDELDAFLRERD